MSARVPPVQPGGGETAGYRAGPALSPRGAGLVNGPRVPGAAHPSPGLRTIQPPGPRTIQTAMMGTPFMLPGGPRLPRPADPTARPLGNPSVPCPRGPTEPQRGPRPPVASVAGNQAPPRGLPQAHPGPGPQGRGLHRGIPSLGPRPPGPATINRGQPPRTLSSQLTRVRVPGPGGSQVITVVQPPGHIHIPLTSSYGPMVTSSSYGAMVTSSYGPMVTTGSGPRMATPMGPLGQPRFSTGVPLTMGPALTGVSTGLQRVPVSFTGSMGGQPRLLPSMGGRGVPVRQGQRPLAPQGQRHPGPQGQRHPGPQGQRPLGPQGQRPLGPQGRGGGQVPPGMGQSPARHPLSMTGPILSVPSPRTASRSPGVQGKLGTSRGALYLIQPKPPLSAPGPGLGGPLLGGAQSYSARPQSHPALPQSHPARPQTLPPGRYTGPPPPGARSTGPALPGRPKTPPRVPGITSVASRAAPSTNARIGGPNHASGTSNVSPGGVNPAPRASNISSGGSIVSTGSSNTRPAASNNLMSSQQVPSSVSRVSCPGSKASGASSSMPAGSNSVAAGSNSVAAGSNSGTAGSNSGTAGSNNVATGLNSAAIVARSMAPNSPNKPTISYTTADVSRGTETMVTKTSIVTSDMTSSKDLPSDVRPEMDHLHPDGLQMTSPPRTPAMSPCRSPLTPYRSPVTPPNAKIALDDLNPHLLCVLCGGYLIDATTIIECLHSFCRTCIHRYLESSKYCPICDVQVHKTRPLLNCRTDNTLQTLVYKLVPGLFKEEMKRRREYYAANPDAGPPASTATNAREQRGEVKDEGEVLARTESKKTSEKISLCLQYSDRLPDPKSKKKKKKTTLPIMPDEESDKRYLLCPSGVTVAHLKKFLRLKFDLDALFKVELFHSDSCLQDNCTLEDITLFYTWKRVQPLKLYYVVQDVRLCAKPTSLKLVQLRHEYKLERLKSDKSKSHAKKRKVDRASPASEISSNQKRAKKTDKMDDERTCVNVDPTLDAPSPEKNVKKSDTAALEEVRSESSPILDVPPPQKKSQSSDKADTEQDSSKVSQVPEVSASHKKKKKTGKEQKRKANVGEGSGSTAPSPQKKAKPSEKLKTGEHSKGKRKDKSGGKGQRKDKSGGKKVKSKVVGNELSNTMEKVPTTGDGPVGNGPMNCVENGPDSDKGKAGSSEPQAGGSQAPVADRHFALLCELDSRKGPEPRPVKSESDTVDSGISDSQADSDRSTDGGDTETPQVAKGKDGKPTDTTAKETAKEQGAEVLQNAPLATCIKLEDTQEAKGVSEKARKESAKPSVSENGKKDPIKQCDKVPSVKPKVLNGKVGKIAKVSKEKVVKVQQTSEPKKTPPKSKASPKSKKGGKKKKVVCRSSSASRKRKLSPAQQIRIKKLKHNTPPSGKKAKKSPLLVKLGMFKSKKAVEPPPPPARGRAKAKVKASVSNGLDKIKRIVNRSKKTETKSKATK